MTSSIDKAGFYGDFKALAALKREAKADSGGALRAAAQQFESLFTEMMLKSMRAAKVGDALTGSDEMDFYQGMFDQQLAVQLSKGKGMGLADMLVQQLTRSGLVTTPPSDQGEATAHSSQPAISSTWPPATPQQFVARLLPHAEAAAAKLGVDPATLVAHAALETGWGRHMPATAQGASGFNFFGIKAAPSWSGQVLDASTLEYEDGVPVQRIERFKAYDSPADCFNDYAKLLNARYQQAVHSDDAAGFAQALQQHGYATDPRYAAKLTAVAGAVKSIQAQATQVGATEVDT